MQSSRIVRCASFAGLWLGLVSLAGAETLVEVSDLHNCCGACKKAITKAVTDAGALPDVANGGDSLVIKASDAATAQKALDNLAAAGFHGTAKGDGVKMPNDSGAPAGKATRLEVRGAHNCCRGCSQALLEACKEVGGVESAAVSPKMRSFTVEGNFDAQTLVKALNDAGFHVKVSAQ
jgi:copper chaperone CopZ